MNYKSILTAFSFVFMSMQVIAQSQNISDKNSTKPGEGSILSSTATLNDHYIRPGKRVVYELDIADSSYQYKNKTAHVMAINGLVPGPVLYFTEGDTAYITVKNRMPRETSMHWHGLLVPNQYDGVPYLTTAPIKPGESHLFIFPLKQTGTYWYHSHSMLEEQSGLYGSIVIYPQQKKLENPEQVLLFSDWTRRNPNEVLRMLKRQTDWFAIQKGSVQSYGEAAEKGYVADRLKQDWMRMPTMDISDIKYDRFLVNGQNSIDLKQFKPGETVRLRLIDGSSSTYFWLQFSGGQMTVVAADGLEVQPVKVDKLLMGVAETYDVLIKIPANGRYEFRATAQDVSGKVSAFIGTGNTVFSPDFPKIPYFKMMHTMNQMMGGMKNMTMGAVASSKVKNDGLTMGDQKMQMDDMGGMDMGGMKMKDPTQNKEKTKPMKGMDMAQSSSPKTKMDGMKMGGMKMNDSTPNKEKTKPMKGMDMAQSSSPKTKMDGMKMGDMDMGGMNMKDDGKGVKMGPGGSMMLGMGGGGKILTYAMLKAKASTEISDSHPVRTYQLYLTGNMQRYVWSINNKVLSEADCLLIKKGEKVRFVLHNTTMMEHPMHLHGHFFRVINGQEEYAPLKHTVSIEPMKDQTFEFEADDAHDWFFHCHILYHMMGGMARVVRYEDTPSNPEVAKYQPSNPLINDDKKLFLWGENSFHSQGINGSWFLSNTRYELNADYRVSYDGRYELDPRVQRYLDHRQFLAAYVGAEFRDEVKGNPPGKNSEQVAVAGFRYLLPMFVQTDVRISSKGRFRLMLGRQDIPLTNRLRLGAAYNTDNEWQVESKYILAKNFAFSANYDNQYGFGGGLTLIY